MAVDWEYKIDPDNIEAQWFTNNQLKVLVGMANGLSYKEVAADRKGKPSTVRSHMSGKRNRGNAPSDLGLFGIVEGMKIKRDRTALVVWAISVGLLVDVNGEL